VFEILGSKRIGVTSLTSWITWRYRSRDHSIPHRISNWWSYGTKPLCPTISEIFSGEYDAMFDM